MGQFATIVALFNVRRWMDVGGRGKKRRNLGCVYILSHIFTVQTNAVRLRVAKIQRMCSLVRSPGLSRSTRLSCPPFIHIGRTLGVTAASAPPLPHTHYLHYEQMCQELQPLNQGRMTNGWISPRVKGRVVSLTRPWH